MKRINELKRINEWKYLTILVSLLSVVILFPILRSAIDTRLVLDILISFLFLATLFLVFPDRTTRVLALVLAVPTLVGIWTGYFLPDLPRQTLAAVLHVFAALFFALTVVVILRDVNRAREVALDTIYGAFCGYLFTGLLFAHLYSMMEVLQPGSFRSDAFVVDMASDRRHYLLAYFSYVTLATVGYGDITPSSDSARGLAVIEAIVGQFYIAALVGVLIGKRVSQGFPATQDASAPTSAVADVKR